MDYKQTTAILFRRVRVALFVALIFAAGYGFGTAGQAADAQSRIRLPDGAEALFDPLFEAFNMINREYIEPVPPEELIDGAIRGMMLALDDPYSNYVNAEYFPFIGGDLEGSIEGIGVIINEMEEGGRVQILTVLPDTPAERSGLQVGDIFYAVEGENVEGLTNLELAARVRGPAGTSVALTILRGDDLIDFDVRRERIEVPNVEHELLDDDIAYISMAQFTTLSRQQVEQALADLSVNSRRGLIFDLRGNSGGYLSAAVDIAALFIEEGTILIEEFAEDRVDTFKIIEDQAYRIDENGNQRLYSTRATYAGVNVPVVVLVDERSASAAELVTGAWQDNNAVTVIGVPTFGKGTVQTQRQLVNGGGVRLTIARWLTPAGRSISGEGVLPDVVVAMPEEDEIEAETGADVQLQAAIDFLLADNLIEQSAD
ncbi:MAG: S41 family peptidase [Anaerolineaceae bacterium]|nr:MAG: S41 family peptidase [Anaerolineaceae bacterium]